MHVLVAVPSTPTSTFRVQLLSHCPSFEVWFFVSISYFQALPFPYPQLPPAVLGMTRGVTSDTCTSDLFVPPTMVLFASDLSQEPNLWGLFFGSVVGWREPHPGAHMRE
jgi:hypothetical protein